MLSALKKSGVSFVVTLPDSRLNKLQGLAKHDPGLTVVEVANEGEGIAICAGLWTGGRRAVMMMEDTGIYEGALALEKLGNQNEIPVVMLVGYHGPIGEGNWFQVSRAPITLDLLKTLRIPFVELRGEVDVEQPVRRAYATATSSKRPVAILCGERLT